MKVLILAAGYGTRLEVRYAARCGRRRPLRQRQNEIESMLVLCCVFLGRRQGRAHRRLEAPDWQTEAARPARYEMGLRCTFFARNGVVDPPVPSHVAGGIPLATHWLGYLAELKLTGDALYIVTNQHNHSQFEAWAKTVSFPVSHLICDGSTSNSTRLGAIRDIALVIERAPIEDDLLVIGTVSAFLPHQRTACLALAHATFVACCVGGDTLFFSDFSLQHVMKTFDERKDGASLVLWYESVDTRKTGILLTDSKSVVNG
jgi:hypothetical protein